MRFGRRAGFPTYIRDVFDKRPDRESLPNDFLQCRRTKYGTEIMASVSVNDKWTQRTLTKPIRNAAKELRAVTREDTPRRCYQNRYDRCVDDQLSDTIPKECW